MSVLTRVIGYLASKEWAITMGVLGTIALEAQNVIEANPGGFSLWSLIPVVVGVLTRQGVYSAAKYRAGSSE